jgi:hypothetical protein
MRLLTVRVARSIWLIPFSHLNPRGRNILPALPAVVERYGFAKPPTPESITATPLKIVFEMGSFTNPQGVPTAVTLTLHDDGLVADTRSSTDDGDLFLADLLSWAAEEYQLADYKELGVKKVYSSEVFVKFQKPLDVFNEKFSTFADAIKSGLGPDQQEPMELVALIFGSDPANGRQSLLRIEREANAPFGENRYYSYAPIKTTRHLELLDLFEKKAT